MEDTKAFVQKEENFWKINLYVFLFLETLPDALGSGCTKCNDKQKQTAEKVIRHLTQKRPRDWDRLSKKYDPQGLHKKRYEEQFAKSKA